MNSTGSATRMRASALCFIASLACTAGSAPQAHAADTVFPDAKPAFRVFAGGGMNQAAALSDGSAIVVGNFDAVNGVAMKNIARRLADGSVDPNFNLMPDFGVASVAVDASDAIYVVGGFSVIGGVPRAKFAKLAANGTVDPGFNASPLQFPQQVVVGGGSIYVSGFNSVNGSPVYGVVKMSPTGAVDPNFGVALGGASGPDIGRIAFDDSTNSLYVSGFFGSVNGVTAPFVAKIGADGTVDPAFAPGANLGFQAIAPDRLGHLYVGGGFTAIGGAPQARLAKINAATGALVASWNPSLTGGQQVSDIALIGDAVYPIGLIDNVDGKGVSNLVRISATTGEVDAGFNAGPSGLGSFSIEAVDGRLLVGSGTLRRVSGQERLGAAIINPDGTIGPAFDLLAPGQVSTMATAANGDTVIGGDFMYLGALRRTRLAKIDAAGDVVADFAPNLDGRVTSVAIDPAGTFVYVAGEFDFSGNAPAPSLGRFALATGEYDTTWKPQPFGMDGVPGARVVSVSSGGIFVGGVFTEMFMQGRGRLAKLDPVDGTAVAAFDANVAANVTQVSASPDGSAVFVAGNFATIGGQNRRGVAKVDAATGMALPWSADVNVGASVSGFAHRGSDVYVIGDFSTIGGASRPRLAKLDATTSAVDLSFDPAFNGFGMNAIAVGPGDSLFVTGNFSLADGQSRARLAKLVASTGELDASWIADTYWSDLSALAVDAAGDLVLGGRAGSSASSQYVSLVPRYGVAKLPTSVPPPVALPDPVFANGFE